MVLARAVRTIKTTHKFILKTTSDRRAEFGAQLQQGGRWEERERRQKKRMGNTSSGEEGSGGVTSPNILSKVTLKGGKADVDAFLTEGRVNNVHIGYVTKKQVN